MMPQPNSQTALGMGTTRIELFTEVNDNPDKSVPEGALIISYGLLKSNVRVL